MRETGDPTRETDTAAEVPRARATTVHIFWSRGAGAMGSTKNDQLFYIYSIILYKIVKKLGAVRLGGGSGISLFKK